MKLFPFTSRARRPVIVAAQFQEVMRRSAVARELFLPTDRARWDGGNYTLGRWARRAQRPVNTGVRLHEPLWPNPGQLPEKDTQNDLHALVRSVAELRKIPELSGVVLSSETLVGTQRGAIPGKRLLFGLRCSASGRFKNERSAAKACYRAMRKAVSRAGYIIEYPTSGFDPGTGLDGLAEWTRSVLLRRRKVDRRWYLLLLLPLLLLIPGVRGCLPEPATFFGIRVETDSLLILFDKSGSMEEYFSVVRDEARKLLEERRRQPGHHFADLIVYDKRSASALEDLQPVTTENINRITAFINGLIPGGKTNLAAGIDLAAAEVCRHGQRATLLIFTDGEEDPSIADMIRNKDKVRGKFRGVPVTIHAISPRVLKPGATPTPATPDETSLMNFCQLFGGQFGPTKGVP
jgi:hypothetical protein